MGTEIRILGPLLVERDGEVLDLGAPRQRAVLACPPTPESRCRSTGSSRSSGATWRRPALDGDARTEELRRALALAEPLGMGRVAAVARRQLSTADA